jgi:hypothetical protein
MSTQPPKKKTHPMQSSQTLLASNHIDQLNQHAKTLAQLNLFLYQQTQTQSTHLYYISAINETCLTITTPNAMQATKLKYQYQSLLKRLKQHPKMQHITHIVFRIQPQRPLPLQPSLPNRPPISAYAKQLIARLAQTIEHPGLKKALANIAKAPKNTNHTIPS